MEKETLTLNYESNEEIEIEELIPEDKKHTFIRAEVDGRLRELSYLVKGPCKITLFNIVDSESVLIYKNSLRYVISMAIHNLYPKMPVIFSNDISRTMYCAPVDTKYTINLTKLKAIEDEVKRLISLDLPITKRLVTKAEARRDYKSLGMADKLGILKYRSEQMVHQYACLDYRDYMYGYMIPSTGYLNKFKFIPSTPGFLIQFPRSESDGELPPFVRENVFSKTINASRNWGKLVGVDTISGINSMVEELGSTDFIMMSEAHHSNMLAELTDRIIKSESPIRLICIAGPSSSGKTTFANRLRLQLLSVGIRAIRISIDDYYLSRDEIKRDENGEIDLESVDALDIKLLNEQMLQLIEGDEVVLPHFDFKLGKRVAGRKLKVEKNQPIIIEGIHALNDDLTSLISKSQKFKIFIAPQAQINIDNHNPISLTDLRLLRRIVRDSKFRHASAEETIRMWPSVRNGEFKWIYKTQESADYVFNSFLPYELCVMKEYAYPLLAKVDKNSDCYITCRRLLLFLKYLVNIEEDDVPDNSLMREFIGGSCFKDV